MFFLLYRILEAQKLAAPKVKAAHLGHPSPRLPLLNKISPYFGILKKNLEK
jgi:hypothetical protein